MAKIELFNVVRETISKLITIENPLEKPVEIKRHMLVSSNDNVLFNPAAFTIPARSVRTFRFD